MIKNHPIQPLIIVDNIERFKENKIVRYLLDHGGIDLNQIGQQFFPQEDEEQFAQLIGYSWSGFCDISYASNRVCEVARNMTDKEMDEKDARIAYLEEVIKTIKQGIKIIAPAVYRMHPDDFDEMEDSK